MKKRFFCFCLLITGFLPFMLFGQQNPQPPQYGNVLRIGGELGQITLLSYGTYSTDKNARKVIAFRVEAKNTAVSGKKLSQSTLELGSGKEYYFELRSGDRIYTPDLVRKLEYPSLAPRQTFVFKLSFTVDAAETLPELQLRYVSKTRADLRTPWLPLKTFFAKAPQDTRIMARHGYFTLRSYYLSEPDKDKKRRLILNLILANDRNYSSYFTTGIIPETTLIYAGDRYYFELMAGAKKTIYPITIVPPTTSERPDKRASSGKSTERELVLSDVRDLTLTYILPPDADLKQLQLRYKDAFGYVDPSDWLPLAPYMASIPPIQAKLRQAPQKAEKQSSSQ